MKKQIESIVIENKNKHRLRIYRVEHTDKFCIGSEDGEHFVFEAGDADDITSAINEVVESFY